jgi:hypothetical protein
MAGGELFGGNTDILASMSDMINTLHKMDGKMKKIYDVVVGNEEFDQEGLIGRVKSLEKYKEEAKARYYKLFGGFIVGGAVWTLIWELIKIKLKL